MPIGADPGAVRSMVLRHGLALAIGGVVVGTVVSLVLSRLIQSLLHGVSPHDPATFAAVPAVLMVVALLASWLPARRATRVDPILALREQ